MAKKKIQVEGKDISIIQIDDSDFINITDVDYN